METLQRFYFCDFDFIGSHLLCSFRLFLFGEKKNFLLSSKKYYTANPLKMSSPRFELPYWAQCAAWQERVCKEDRARTATIRRPQNHLVYKQTSVAPMELARTSQRRVFPLVHKRSCPPLPIHLPTMQSPLPQGTRQTPTRSTMSRHELLAALRARLSKVEDAVTMQESQQNDLLQELHAIHSTIKQRDLLAQPSTPPTVPEPSTKVHPAKQSAQNAQAAAARIQPGPGLNERAHEAPRTPSEIFSDFSENAQQAKW